MNDGLYPDWKKWQSWVWMAACFAVLYAIAWHAATATP